MRRYSLAALAAVLSLSTQPNIQNAVVGFRNIPPPQIPERGLVLGPPSQPLDHEKRYGKRKNKFPFQKRLKRDFRHKS